MRLKVINAELLIAKGIEQKVPDAIIPDESLARAENVDFSKVGTAKKRSGFDTNSTLVLGAGVLDEVKRLGVRQRREVLCISETTVQLGSAAGVGNTGDTLFSYSEEAEKWVARGKMPRPNLDVLWTSGIPAAGSVGNPQQYVTGGYGNYVCVAYQAQEFSTVRVIVFDVGGDVNGAVRESPTVVIDTTFTAPLGSYLCGWAEADGKVWLVYGTTPLTAVAGPESSWARAFRPGAVTFDLIPVSVKSDACAYAVSTDGADIYVAVRYGTGGYEIRRFNADMALIESRQQNGIVMDAQEVALDARLGHVDVVRHSLLSGIVRVSRLSKVGLIELMTNVFVTTGSTSALGVARSNLTIATVSETDAVILWANQGAENITTRPTYLSVGLVRMTSGALLGYFNHMGLVPYAQPFIIDGRCYFVAMHSSGLVRPGADPTYLTGTITGEESFMCFQIPLDNMNPYNVPFPCAQWDFGRCAAKLSFFGSVTNGTYWMDGRTVYQSADGVYVLSNIATAAGQSGSQYLPSPRLVRLEFGDATHRWRHEEFHDLAAFAGGIPFIYDGTRTYEMATALHAPAVLNYGLAPGGAIPDTTEVLVRFAMLFIDGNGRECWSLPTNPFTATVATPNLAITGHVMPVTTTVKPDMGNQFIGRMYLYCFAASGNSPNEYRVAAPPVRVDPFQIDEVEFFITSLTESNTQMYTSGFELDNFPAPPCRAMVVHSGRVFMIASDSNDLFYSKPFNGSRGVEIGFSQRIPLPDKGTALASLNDKLAVFTHRSILIVSGDGPDVTGSPPDGFSRPVLVSPDYGCIEYCAVGRTPLGIIFRGQQGFYLLDMGFDVKYIGGSVEDITSQWTATRSIVHDQKAACCRITGFNGERSEELCFWYDTKRWSLNVMGADVADSIALGDNLLLATTDTTVAVASRFKLGTRATAQLRQDFGRNYEQVLETGWLSFQQAGVFKRVWRAYVLARAIDADVTVRIQAWKDWEERVSSDREFLLNSRETEPRNLRVHLKHQKLKAVKLRVTMTSDGGGAEVMKIGFELGMRTGGPKEAQESTQ